MEKKTELQPAITTYFKRLQAFMEADPDIKVELDYDNNMINVTVHNAVKAAAWREILPMQKSIGDFTFSINIYNNKDGVDKEILLAAMQGNPHFSRFIEYEELGFHYCYLKPDIIQFNNDNLGSPEMIETRTAEDLATEIFDVPLLSFCSEIK